MMKEDGIKTVENADIDFDVALNVVSRDQNVSVWFVKKALSCAGYESSLLQLNKIVQSTMMFAVSQMYGHFASLNTPILSNRDVLTLVDKYKELMPVHHASIVTMLHVDEKVKNKRN